MHSDLKRPLAAAAALVIIIAILAGISIAAAPAPSPVSGQMARNLIVIIGDGMGMSHRKLGSLNSKHGLAMDGMPVTGIMDTSSYNLTITDSAASATAMFSGRKTYNGVVGYDYELDAVTSIMKLASKAGMATGIITNSALYDPTSAAMYANALIRSDYKGISKQLLSSFLDLAVGGGADVISPLLELAKLSSKKPRFNDSYSLHDLAEGPGFPAICLLSRSHMPLEIDRKEGPSLEQMVDAGLKLLTKDGRPFILLIESGSTDRCSHDNDAAGVLKAVLDLDKAVTTALEYARGAGDTLVLVTADHETGGLSLGSGDGMNIDVSKLSSVKASASSMADDAADNGADIRSVILKNAPWFVVGPDDGLDGFSSSAYKARTIGAALSKTANISWGSGWHTAEPVPVTAEGPQALLFSGWYKNTALFERMKSALGL